MGGRVAVRLEGGIGDHILGMRLLKFIRQKYPSHPIRIYSDCAGNSAQLEVAALSPLVESVTPVFQDPEKVTLSSLGAFENLVENDRTRIAEEEVYFDGSTRSLFILQSRLLGISYHEILASRPALRIPDFRRREAAALLAPGKGCRYIALNLGNLEASTLRQYLPYLKKFFKQLLTEQDIYIVNILSHSYKFPHWPTQERQRREVLTRENAELNMELLDWHPRIIGVVDQPIQTVTAILKCCRHFVGIDNGIRHIAWALNVPSTILVGFQLDDASLPQKREALLRWFPDVHSLVPVNEFLADPARTYNSMINRFASPQTL